MPKVPGTTGYQAKAQAFAKATESVDFHSLHRAFIPFIPNEPTQLLDVGAGVGCDASVFASWGHQVVAVEPLNALSNIGKAKHSSRRIVWVKDSLPGLEKIHALDIQFGFVLASAVWHHLNADEQHEGLCAIKRLLKKRAYSLCLFVRGHADWVRIPSQLT